jgi:hypothetical protein
MNQARERFSGPLFILKASRYLNTAQDYTQLFDYK